MKLVIKRHSPSFCHFPSLSGPNLSAHCSQIPITFDTLTYCTLSVPLDWPTQTVRFSSDFCMVYVLALQQHQPTPVNKRSIE